MRKPLHCSPALRVFCLASLAAFSLLAGCGKVHGWLSNHRRGRAMLSRVQKVRGWFSRLQFQEEPNEPHSVTITWVASKSPVLGYNVYREFQYEGPVKLTPQILPGTQYTDTTVKRGRTYTYYITSVNSKGLESVPSERITVTVPMAAASSAK
jgi:hypothetical protein